MSRLLRHPQKMKEHSPHQLLYVIHSKSQAAVTGKATRHMGSPQKSQSALLTHPTDRIPVFKPKVPAQHVPSPTKPLTIAQKDATKRYSCFPDDDDDDNSSDGFVDIFAARLAKIRHTRLGDSLNTKQAKQPGIRKDRFWVVFHGRVMGIFDELEDVENVNNKFLTAQVRGYPMQLSAKSAWDHAWRNERIVFWTAGVSPANEFHANDNVELYWIFIEGLTPGLHRNHTGVMVAVGEDNPCILHVTWTLGDAYDVQSWGVSHGLIKYRH